MKKNNGLTMVEVMVTIAVMAVLASIGGITIGVLLSQRVKSMAADTKSVIQSTQMVALTRDDAYVHIYQDGDNVVVQAYIASGNKMINDIQGNNMEVSVLMGNATDPVPVTSTGVDIKFNRQTGGIVSNTGDPQDDNYVKKIIFSNGNRTVTLTISKLTGKVTY